jgi:hypothetical protein
MYLFVYGILVDPDAVQRTLDRPFDRAGMRSAVLTGWVRAWNVASDKVSHPERTFLTPDGAEFDGVTVALGIVRRDDGAECEGAVIPVNDADLAGFDRRERSYDRVDVTDSVHWVGKPDKCVVHTYVPRAEVSRRVEEARISGRTVCVRKAYVDTVRASFARIGRLDMFERSTAVSGLGILELETVIDSTRAPNSPLRANG